MPKFTPETVRKDSHDGVGHPCGAFEALLFSDSGGLTQFGAFVETLPPGSSSSIKHWHSSEDEMLYMLSGEVLVHEGGHTFTLQRGEAATFKAGAPLGHFVENVSETSASYLMIGTRSSSDVVTYPENDRVLSFERGPDGEIKNRRYTTLSGEPADSPYLHER
ncbi:cupin domain-containing protein [Celeribacter arenosi]|uniref:Cupin domain-containing protein n=1 Tax=Celeribacter arenosi TaxID=792649 RepID=A0ABP7K5J9_9RHOB